MFTLNQIKNQGDRLDENINHPHFLLPFLIITCVLLCTGMIIKNSMLCRHFGAGMVEMPLIYFLFGLSAILRHIDAFI